MATAINAAAISRALSDQRILHTIFDVLLREDQKALAAAAATAKNWNEVVLNVTWHKHEAKPVLQSHDCFNRWDNIDPKNLDISVYGVRLPFDVSGRSSYAVNHPDS